VSGQRFETEEPYGLLDDDLPGLWQRVTGGGLSTPLLVRIGQGRDGRPVVNGLIIGAEEPPPEITTDSLRSIRLGALLAQLFENFDPENPPTWEDGIPDQVEWGLIHEHVWRPAVRSGASSRGPSDAELDRFARTYQREFIRNRRRAMTATAEEMGISRATANRWAERCRDRGYLPPGESKKSGRDGD